jgi:hypothetical protein
VKAVKEGVSGEMRFGAALISAQMLASVASAETLPEKMASLLQDVCVSPASSEARMAAGEKAAATENWKVIRSGPAPIVMMHNENGAKIAFENFWDLDGLKFYVSIVRPEMPGFRYDVCMVHSDGIDEDDLTQAIDHKFGSAVTSDKRYRNQRGWFFADEKARGNCGKRIYLSRSIPSETPALVFQDIVFPNEPASAKASFTGCPIQ